MPRPYQFTISLRDDKGRTGRVSGYIPDSWTLAQVQQFVSDFMLRMDAISTAKIEGCNITLPATLPAGLKSLAALSSDIEEKLTFSYTNGQKPSARFSVPAIFDAGTAVVPREKKRVANFLDPDINNFHDLIVNAPTIGYPSHLTDQRGQYAAAILRSTSGNFIESGGRRRFK